MEESELAGIGTVPLDHDGNVRETSVLFIWVFYVYLYSHLSPEHCQPPCRLVLVLFFSPSCFNYSRTISSTKRQLQCSKAINKNILALFICDFPGRNLSQGRLLGIHTVSLACPFTEKRIS